MKKEIASILLLFTLLITFILFTFSNKNNTIKVSGGVTSESQILGHIVVELLSYYTDEKIVFLNNLGTATIVQAAMVKGDIDISATRYTGTDLVGTLQLPLEKEPHEALQIVQHEFHERYQFEWFPSYGFSNQFTFMVTQETAEKYNLSKVSDLQEHANSLTLGTDTSWHQRAGDGYKAFTEFYGMDFKRVYPMQAGLLYDALASDNLSVILGYSTDGRVGSYDLVMLEDDYLFFPPYTSSLVATEKVLQENPQLRSILLKLENTIDTQTMQQMNNAADTQLIEPSIIAKQFLTDNNYFE